MKVFVGATHRRDESFEFATMRRSHSDFQSSL